MEKIFSKSCFKFLPFVLFAGIGEVHAASFALFDIMDTLTSLQQILSQVGPLLSTVLFIIAGIFYAVGQLLPPDKRANFHTTSINIIIGAVMVAVLSVASSGLALASTHLLVNISTNAIK
ncbi:MAG: hypothetical protein KGH53_02675 [Candidatus Micrarchaeota archaeon]|nr:hypothetical protein [Candidatus Micrarchaeota archaeon]